MNYLFRRTAIAASIIISAAVFSAAKTIVIYHTSDVHGWYSARPALWNKANPKRMIGGFAALSALANKEKTPHILIDSGDWYQGTPEGNITKGMASITMMNALGYAACEIGNHEYDFGEDNVRALASSATCAALGANIYVKETGERADYAKPYVIKEVDGIKLGIIGVITEDTVTSTLPKNVARLEFKDKAKEAAALAAELKKQGVNAVILAAHSGVCLSCTGKKIDGAAWTPQPLDIKEGNIAIAREAKGNIDLILGGHIHAGLTNGYRDAESGTLFTESYSQLTSASRIALEFDDKTGKLTGSSSRLIDLWTDETGEDQKVLDALEPIAAKVGAEMDRVIGQIQAPLLRSYDGADSPIGNWFADAMLKYSGVQIAMQNNHGIRSDIPKGDITARTIYQVMPFDNTLVTMEMTGEQVADVMRQNLNSSGMQIAGLEVEYSTGAAGIADMRITVGGKPLDPQAVYTVATNSYLAGGGTGGEAFKKAKNVRDTMVNIRDILIGDIKSSSPIRPPATGRIKLIGRGDKMGG